MLTAHVCYGSYGEFFRYCPHVWTQTDRKIPSVILLLNVANEKSILEGAGLTSEIQWLSQN